MDKVTYDPVQQMEMSMTKEASTMSWWNQRSSLEKCLIYITTVSITITIILLTGMGTMIYIDLKAPGVCLTPSCVKSASELLQNMNPLIDPCDDFYEFACGGWKERVDPDDEMAFISMMGSMQTTLMSRLKDIVEEPASLDDPIYVLKMKLLYFQCVEGGEGESEYQDDIITMGHFPAIKGTEWINRTWEQIEVAGYDLGFAGGHIMPIDITLNVDDNTQGVIAMVEPTFSPLNRKQLLEGVDHDLVQTYLNTTLRILHLLGSNEEDNDRKEMMDMVTFEVNLAKLTTPEEEKVNYTSLFQVIPLDEVKQFMPEVDVMHIINHKFPSFNINGSEPIMVENKEFLIQINSLIKSTPKRVIANYLMMKTFFQVNSLMSREYRVVMHDLEEALMDGGEEGCLSGVNKLFSPVMGSLYVKKHLNAETHLRVKDIVTRIEKQFVHEMKQITWMKPDKKQDIVTKVSNIKHIIGFSEVMIDPKTLLKLYGDLKVHVNHSLYENVMIINRWAHEKEWKQLRDKIERDDWTQMEDVTAINAYYSDFTNMVLIPAGIMQQLLIQPDRPDYLNYGGIGFVVGHELVHSLDQTGLQFDGQGNRLNIPFEENEKIFSNRTRCLSDHYNKMPLKEHPFNVSSIQMRGEVTASEDVADNGGLKVAYAAYRRFIDEKGKEEDSLPGVDFTPDQIFFLTKAHFHCAKYLIDQLEREIEDDIHSPSKYRVLGSLRNNADFGRVFNCPTGSYMNPKEKCQVW